MIAHSELQQQKILREESHEFIINQRLKAAATACLLIENKWQKSTTTKLICSNALKATIKERKSDGEHTHTHTKQNKKKTQKNNRRLKILYTHQYIWKHLSEIR